MSLRAMNSILWNCWSYLLIKWQINDKLLFCVNTVELSNAMQSNLLTLNVWGSSYLGLSRSISWLLMPWLLTSPTHQQPWYWLHRICRSLSYLRKNFKYLCHISMWRNDIECKYTFMFTLKNLAHKGLLTQYIITQYYKQHGWQVVYRFHFELTKDNLHLSRESKVWNGFSEY